jgi:hypothetical protein
VYQGESLFDALWNWTYDLPISLVVRESSWLFPTLECIHLYSMISLIALVALFDLRLMGFAFEPKPVSHFSRMVRRWIWLPLLANVITGTLLFISKPMEYSSNYAFRLKMLFLLFGVAYHAVILRRAHRWDNLAVMPLRISALGVFSLCLWIGVLASSRWIAYVIV